MEIFIVISHRLEVWWIEKGCWFLLFRIKDRDYWRDDKPFSQLLDIIAISFFPSWMRVLWIFMVLPIVTVLLIQSLSICLSFSRISIDSWISGMSIDYSLYRGIQVSRLGCYNDAINPVRDPRGAHPLIRLNNGNYVVDSIFSPPGEAGNGIRHSPLRPRTIMVIY